VAAAASFVTGLVGTIYPPLYYALRRDVPASRGMRAMAYFIVALGLGLGLSWAWWAGSR